MIQPQFKLNDARRPKSGRFKTTAAQREPLKDARGGTLTGQQVVWALKKHPKWILERVAD